MLIWRLFDIRENKADYLENGRLRGYQVANTYKYDFSCYFSSVLSGILVS